MEVMIATRNKDKIKEIVPFIPKWFSIKSYQDYLNLPYIDEDGKTLEENALKKARIISLKTGLITISDDSGLEVEFLDGKPGVLSARWAGEGSSYKDNNIKLLKELNGVPFNKRKALFKCVIAIVFPKGKEKIFKGELKGYILEKPKGNNGFGYDPIFYLPNLDKTLAEIPLELKNKISHRAIALRKLKSYLLKMKQ